MIRPVPSSVNVEELISRLKLSPTRRENLLNKLNYFLSTLAITNDNHHLFEKTGGYRRVSSVIMKKVLDREDYSLILKILSDPEDPIIESNNSWRNSNKGSQKGFCKGYRLTSKYNTGEVIYRNIDDKLALRINKHLGKTQFDDSKYEFLYNQFDSHELTFDPLVFTYIKNFGQQLLQRIRDDNQYQIKMVYNLIGRWLYHVEKLEYDPWYKVSANNNRLNSSFTHLKRTLRPFLLCDGRPLGIVDIRASQSYILASIMSDTFLCSTNSGYNMYSIYPKAYDLLAIYRNTNCGNKQFENISFSGSPVNAEFVQYSGTSTYHSSGANCGDFNQSYSFMWGEFISPRENEDIRKYKEIPFEDDYYKFVLTGYQSTHGQEIYFNDKERQKFKDTVMLILFDDNQQHRDNIEYIKVFSEIFPGVDKWITEMHKRLGNYGFSYLLQRTESYLILDGICRQFNSKFPLAPLFTIHDAVITYPEFLPELRQLIQEQSYAITGIKAGLKSELPKFSVEPNPEDIEEEWRRIKPINTQIKYQEMSYHVFPGNILRGSEFLS